uniref:Uncharacterized protein n=1 Tax=Anguilla anguilla TaxID=7936 RepID=A0A0E9VIX5_ANGAN
MCHHELVKGFVLFCFSSLAFIKGISNKCLHHQSVAFK